MKVVCSFLCSFVMFFSFSFTSYVKASEVEVSLRKINPKGYLKKKYVVYEFIFDNKTSDELNLTNINFSSDESVDIATKDSKSVSQAALGATWATAGLLWFTLIVPAYAIIATPIILIRRSTTRAKTDKELEQFSKLKPRNLKISPNQSDKIVTVFPKDFTRTDLTFNYSSKLGLKSYNQKFIFSEVN